MVGHGGSSASSYLADPASPIPSHCASIVATSTLRVKYGTAGCLMINGTWVVVMEYQFLEQVAEPPWNLGGIWVSLTELFPSLVQGKHGFAGLQ